MAALTHHSNLSGSELHYSKIQNIVGSPTEVPVYIGQTQFDTINYVLYYAKGVSNLADWVSVIGVGGLNSIIEVETTTYTVTSINNNSVIALLNVAARTITMPLTPINGFTVSLYDFAGTSYSANITINASGSDKFYNDSGSSTYKIASDYACITFVYDDGSSVWVPKTSFIGLQPSVKALNNVIGTVLNINSLDTSGINLKVNNQDIVNISSTQATIINSVDLTKKLTFDISGSTTSTITTFATTSTTNKTLTFPDITDTFVTKTTTDILTNKSFGDNVTIRTGSLLRFNNVANTKYSSLSAGNNSDNLDLVLPITAPVAGQALIALDTTTNLGWFDLPTQSNANVPTDPSPIYNLPSSTSTVTITSGFDDTIIGGILAGEQGQQLTIVNGSTQTVTLNYLDGSAASGDKIILYGGLDYKLETNQSIILTYTSSFWFASGVNNARALQGNSGSSLPSTGFISEIINSSPTTFDTGTITISAAIELSTITLTRGVWSIVLGCWGNASVGALTQSAWVSQTSAGGVITYGVNGMSNGTVGSLSVTLPPIAISSTQTYYANGTVDTFGQLARFIGTFYAIRIA